MSAAGTDRRPCMYGALSNCLFGDVASLERAIVGVFDEPDRRADAALSPA